MKAGWQVKKLRDVCNTFADGDWIESKNQSAQGIRLIQTGNIGEGIFKDRLEKARYVSESTFEALRCTEIFEGDCIVSRLPDPVGRSSVLPRIQGRMITVADCTIIRFDPKYMVPKFFNYYSLSNAYLKSVSQNTTGTTRVRITRTGLGQISIPIPSIHEQKRIVKILDEAFAMIATTKAKAEKNLQSVESLFDRQLELIFSQPGSDYTERQFHEVCEITSTLIDPRKKEFLDSIHIGAGNIISKTGLLVDLRTSRQEQLISGKFLFDDSMVLYSKIRPYLMKVSRPNFKGLCSADIYPLNPISGIITRDYLFYMLLSKPFTDYAIKGSARAGMPKVNRDHLFKYKAKMPKIEKQKIQTALLDELQEKKLDLSAFYTKKLSLLDDLKQSLLHQAFAGQL